MKKLITAIAAVLALSGQTNGQEMVKKSTKNHIGLGFSLNSVGGNFGMGINVTSPLFFRGHFAVKVSENYQWLDHLDKNGEHTWTAYHLIKAGALGMNMSISDAIRLYGEGGIAIVLADKGISSESTVIGGYGLFGFEFMMPHDMCYFVELGGIGTGATGDKVPTSPIYANGFMASSGFRVRL